MIAYVTRQTLTDSVRVQIGYTGPTDTIEPMLDTDLKELDLSH